MTKLKLLFILCLLGLTTPASAQQVLNLRVRWTEPAPVDSTVVLFYSPHTASIPTTRTRAISPVYFTTPLPIDTITYRFTLQSFRQNIPSTLFTTSYFFDANAYYVLSGIDVKPDAVTLVAGATQQFCAFIKFNDGTVAMRTQDNVAGECQPFFNQFAVATRVTSGIKQRKADAVCLTWTAAGGTITNEVCP